MNSDVFSFTPEQEANLKKWRAFLNSDDAKQWDTWENKAIGSLHSTLERTGFIKGNDLKAEQLDDIFRDVRGLMSNQALTRNLYEKNGLANFNSRLRKLFFGSEPLAKRVDQFVELSGVGVPTVAQFLCALDPGEYPKISAPTLDVLQLDSIQSDIAYRQALKENDIPSPNEFYGYTIEYLTDTVIFREVKNLLNIDSYIRVNHILWLAHEQVGPELKPITTSVGLEADLRDHLAENPSLIENGLSLIEREYTITGAGRADLVCKDKRGNYVVIETKKAGESDKVVGQILRYVGGLRKEGKKARGIIIVNEQDDKLDFAIEAVKDFIKLKYYKVRFEITDSYTGTAG